MGHVGQWHTHGSAQTLFVLSGGFDARFRRCAERDLAVRAALDGAHFISVDAPLVIQYLTPTADRAGAIFDTAFCWSRSIDVISRRKRLYGRLVQRARPVLPLPRTALVVAAVVYRSTRPLSVGRVPRTSQTLLAILVRLGRFPARVTSS